MTRVNVGSMPPVGVPPGSSDLLLAQAGAEPPAVKPGATRAPAARTVELKLGGDPVWAVPLGPPDNKGQTTYQVTWRGVTVLAPLTGQISAAQFKPGSWLKGALERAWQKGQPGEATPATPAARNQRGGPAPTLRIDLESPAINDRAARDRGMFGTKVFVPYVNPDYTSRHAVVVAQQLGYPVRMWTEPAPNWHTAPKAHAIVDLPNTREGGEAYARMNHQEVGYLGSQGTLKLPPGASKEFKEGYQQMSRQMAAQDLVAIGSTLVVGASTIRPGAPSLPGTRPGAGRQDRPGGARTTVTPSGHIEVSNGGRPLPPVRMRKQPAVQGQSATAPPPAAVKRPLPPAGVGKKDDVIDVPAVTVPKQSAPPPPTAARPKPLPSTQIRQTPVAQPQPNQPVVRQAAEWPVKVNVGTTPSTRPTIPPGTAVPPTLSPQARPAQANRKPAPQPARPPDTAMPPTLPPQARPAPAATSPRLEGAGGITPSAQPSATAAGNGITPDPGVGPQQAVQPTIQEPVAPQQQPQLQSAASDVDMSRVVVVTDIDDAVTRAKVSRPLGMSDEAFQEQLRVIRDAPVFAEAEAVMFHGSRTHFTAGWEPKPDSDLDVSVFFNASARRGLADSDLEWQMNRLDLVDQVTDAFAPLSKEVGFEISEEIPYTMSLQEALVREGSLFNRGVTAEQEAQFAASLKGMTRDDAKKAALTQNQRPHISILRESLIVIPYSGDGMPQGLQMARDLVGRGFRNVMLLERPGVMTKPELSVAPVGKQEVAVNAPPRPHGITPVVSQPMSTAAEGFRGTVARVPNSPVGRAYVQAYNTADELVRAQGGRVQGIGGSIAEGRGRLGTFDRSVWSLESARRLDKMPISADEPLPPEIEATARQLPQGSFEAKLAGGKTIPSDLDIVVDGLTFAQQKAIKAEVFNRTGVLIEFVEPSPGKVPATGIGH